MNKINVVDFFCGCGGTSAGLRNAGLNVIAGIDLDPEAGATFRLNFPEAAFLNYDIRDLTTQAFSQSIEIDSSAPLLISACAPCQPFTKQKTTHRKSDARAFLLDELHRFIEHLLPEYILLENVPGLQRIKLNDGPLGRFIKLLGSCGYSYDVKILKSHDYGVPQIRHRLVLVASRLGPVSVPSPTHGPGTANEQYEDVWKWIGDLPEIAAGEECALIPNHRAASLSPVNLRRISLTPEGGGRLDWPEDLKLACHKDHTGHTDVYGRLWKTRPAAALSTRCISLSNGRYGHPTQNRALSVREAARLQTFGDDFAFLGSMNSMARQIGNAVPVRLAEVMGLHILEHHGNVTSPKA
ncbi:DNA cytosine methyltransferase [Mesorhizobium sp.]|uniref:DNA cytosine methyltransferase n=1 Tax=Mesorhizobium sp. TaxID=1871066 RepID=UPI000FE54207|nr:DNA cytosine methyltransferase [Mesorhizobium sp.]RWD71075.1 MAG: DNA cytosine methyltransferase [Mesorhizobium sp.]TIV32674.1 MAG: DNA cytosine methyltransferase [Mesorhizobium sp.]